MTRTSVLSVAILSTAALSACTYDRDPKVIARAQQVVPTEQFGVKVTDAPERIALGLHPGGLSPNQQATLGLYVSQWRENGGGPITLRAPVGGGSSPALARRMEDQAAAYMTRLGVPAERLRIQGYPATAPNAPLLASYQRFEAEGPNCSGGWKDITTTGSNIPYDHFGCATTANIAVQVANPRDFLAPAVETPADNSRRQVVLGKYRQGQITSSQKDDQADGKVSASAGGGGSN